MSPDVESMNHCFYISVASKILFMAVMFYIYVKYRGIVNLIN